MKVLSLFDGISCARVALERANIPVELYYASEIDKYAIQVSQKNWPKNIQLGSVLDIRISDYSKGMMYKIDIDLLIGGSPCQDLSIAKKDRKGLDGERSGLFWEYVRILREVKPKYFILENVASMPNEAKDIITRELGVEPVMINASLVSAQNRKRLFWVGKLDEFGTYQQVHIPQPEDRGIMLKDILEENVDEKYNYSLGNKINTNQGNRVYGIQNKAVTLKALGGGGGAKTGLYCISSTQAHATITENKSTPLTAAMGMGGGHVPMITNVEPVALRNRGEGKKPEYNGTDKANSMTTVQTDSMVEVNQVIRKLTPVKCERLQGLPDNYTDGISNTQRYKCLGNAFNVDVVAHILSFIPKHDSN